LIFVFPEPSILTSTLTWVSVVVLSIIADRPGEPEVFKVIRVQQTLYLIHWVLG